MLKHPPNQFLGPAGLTMKRRIPREYLLAFARDCLKLQKLLSEADDLAELDKFLHLIRSLEKSGGIAALEALLRPEHADRYSAVRTAPKEDAQPLKGALRPSSHTKEMP